MTDTAFPIGTFAWEAFDTEQPSTTTTSSGAVAGSDGPTRSGSRVLALDTVSDYVSAARALLQDARLPYRYSDVELVLALNGAMFEARRMRPDLYAFSREAELVMFTEVDDTRVPIPPAYRMAHLFYVVGFVQLRDDEATTDSRAQAFMTRFTTQLLTMAG